MESTKISLSVSKIAQLSAEDGKSQTIYWDAKTPNLGLRLTQSGNKAFIFETWFNGKTLRMTIGGVNSWSISQAQAEARRLKVLTDQGIDPREQREELKAKSLANQLRGSSALDIWDEYLKVKKASWGDRHYQDHIDMVRVGGDVITRGRKSGDSLIKLPGILRGLLSNPLNKISRDSVATWLGVESQKRPARARIALSALKAFITWAGDQTKYKGLVDVTCCDRLARELPAKKAKNDCLQVEQLALWFGAVRKINNPVLAAYLQILLITGARRNELATLKWVDVDLQWRVATLKDKVEGQRQIPITPYVASLLSILPRVNQYVFSSPTAKSSHIVEPRKAHNIAIQQAGLPDLSIHGLRRSFGTLAEWVECPVGISAQIMGHKPTAIAERHYRRRSIDLLRVWHTKIEAFILEQAGIEQPKEQDKRLRLVA